jgi:hypothetical protein
VQCNRFPDTREDAQIERRCMVAMKGGSAGRIARAEGKAPNGVERPDPMTALADVVRAAQRVIVARIDLATMQAKDTLQGAAMLAGAALLATFGWVMLMCGAVTLLDDYLPMPAAFAIVGGFHFAAGMVIAFVGRERARPGESTLSASEDEP